jgi:histidine triad (HIT) family protein
MTNEQCVFCDPDEWYWRSIREDELFVSFVSNPRFRAGQCLVIPRRHVTQIDELTPTEAGNIMGELGRLSSCLDKGFGSGIMQKYQPRQAENGIKVNHLHYHVFPRFEEEAGLFPVPEPNTFDGFVKAPEDEIKEWAVGLR